MRCLFVSFFLSSYLQAFLNMLMVVLLPCVFRIVKHCSWIWKHNFGVRSSQMQISSCPCGKLYLPQGLKLHVFISGRIPVSSKGEPCNDNPWGNASIHCVLLEFKNINAYLGAQKCWQAQDWTICNDFNHRDPTVDPVGPGRALLPLGKCSVLMLMH